MQVSRWAKVDGEVHAKVDGEQNIGKYCACKGALRGGALRQEFGFKLLFVPDKSATNAYLTQVLTPLHPLPNKNLTFEISKIAKKMYIFHK